MSEKKPLISFKGIGPAISLLSLITVIHFFLISGCIGPDKFINLNLKYISNISVNVTLLLIVSVYWLFKHIITLVEKNCSPNKLTKELITTYNFTDKPTLYVFFTLFVYSLYVNWTGNLQSMEIFFSGAIAFELILSGFIWTQTEVA